MLAVDDQQIEHAVHVEILHNRAAPARVDRDPGLEPLFVETVVKSAKQQIVRVEKLAKSGMAWTLPLAMNRSVSVSLLISAN